VHRTVLEMPESNPPCASPVVESKDCIAEEKQMVIIIYSKVMSHRRFQNLSTTAKITKRARCAHSSIRCHARRCLPLAPDELVVTHMLKLPRLCCFPSKVLPTRDNSSSDKQREVVIVSWMSFLVLWAARQAYQCASQIRSLYSCQ